MSDKVSRRTFAKLLGVGAAGAVIRPASAQTEQLPATSAKLDERAMQIYAAALRANASAAQGRLRYPLAENSEPCTTFRAEAPKK